MKRLVDNLANGLANGISLVLKRFFKQDTNTYAEYVSPMGKNVKRKVRKLACVTKRSKPLTKLESKRAVEEGNERRLEIKEKKYKMKELLKEIKESAEVNQACLEVLNEKFFRPLKEKISKDEFCDIFANFDDVFKSNSLLNKNIMTHGAIAGVSKSYPSLKHNVEFAKNGIKIFSTWNRIRKREDVKFIIDDVKKDKRSLGLGPAGLLYKPTQRFVTVRNAFESLLKVAWVSEHEKVINSTFNGVVDVMKFFENEKKKKS